MMVPYFLFLLIPIVFANECSPREYGNGYIVCVCNVTYCDSPKPFSVKPGLVSVVESSKGGKRFATTTASFKPGSQFPKHKLFERYADITINRDKKYQKIIGFGGAFTDSATINIRSLPKTLTERLVKDYYSKDGIKYSVGRIPIAGTDFSTRKYAYNEVDGDFNLTNFKLAEEDIEYKIPIIKYAMKISAHPIRLFASAWSSPAWMKTNNDLSGAGVLKGKTNGIYYKTWANYAVKFLDAYRSHGIDLWGMTTGNEPMAGFVPGYRWNCLGFTPFSQRDFVELHLGPALEKSGYTADKFKLMIYDDQLTFLPLFADVILKDANASKYISGIAFHWYENKIAPRSLLDYVHNHFPDKFILATEACEGAGISKHVSMGDWSRGEDYAYDILQDLNHWATGWVDWNLALDLEGGPTWAKNFVDSPVIVNKTAQEYYKNPMFYAMGHFSRFLVPSSVRLGFEIQKSLFNSVLCTVFQTPKQEIVLIALNPSDSQCKFSVRDPKNGVFSTTLDAHSVVTFIWM